MDALRAWYEPRRRAYPWRTSKPDAYWVLVSEVMLQQTQAARVVPAYRSFLRRFPTVRSLAGAPRSEVLWEWRGLGYNRRAVALSEAARAVVRDHGGRVPSDPAVLATLPGIGPYTAAAVASLAFGLPVPALDVNVARVVARSRAGAEPREIPRATLGEIATGWQAGSELGAGEWNQALMDLGRELCRQQPRCPACPLAPSCRFRQSGREAAPSARTQGRFEGSTREARGAVLRVLLEGGPLLRGELVERTGLDGDRVDAAVRALRSEGVVEDRAGSRFAVAD